MYNGTSKWVEIWLSSLGNKLLHQCHLMSGTGITAHLYYHRYQSQAGGKYLDNRVALLECATF